MYTAETIRKYRERMQAAIDSYNNIPVSELSVCISKGNRKIGRVNNVSLPAIFTCPNCSQCWCLCYDIKAAMQYKNVLLARARNYSIFMRDREEYFCQIDRALSRSRRLVIFRRKKRKVFRWHVAGDLLDVDYLRRVIEIARKHPDTVFWLYTKSYDIVNKYVAEHGGSIAAAIPDNLSIMFSEWRGMEMRNPYGFAEFRVVFKGETAPSGSFSCLGNCEKCIALGRGCPARETVYANEH